LGGGKRERGVSCVGERGGDRGGGKRWGGVGKEYIYTTDGLGWFIEFVEMGVGVRRGEGVGFWMEV